MNDPLKRLPDDVADYLSHRLPDNIDVDSFQATVDSVVQCLCDESPDPYRNLAVYCELLCAGFALAGGKLKPTDNG